MQHIYERSKKAHREIKQAAADIGTQTHRAIEAYLRDNSTPPPDEGTPVRSCYDAARNWLSSHVIQTVALERISYSRQFRYIGTPDDIAYVDGVLSLIDWKSSKGIYPEYFLQTAAYVRAYGEETGDYCKKRYIVKLGKEDGQFEVVERGLHHGDFEAFRAALKLYNYLKANK